VFSPKIINELFAIFTPNYNRKALLRIPATHIQESGIRLAGVHVPRIRNCATDNSFFANIFLLYMTRVNPLLGHSDKRKQHQKNEEWKETPDNRHLLYLRQNAGFPTSRLLQVSHRKKY